MYKCCSPSCFQEVVHELIFKTDRYLYIFHTYIYILAELFFGVEERAPKVKKSRDHIFSIDDYCPEKQYVSIRTIHLNKSLDYLITRWQTGVFDCPDRATMDTST